MLVLGLLAKAEGLGSLGVEELFALQAHDLRGRVVGREFLGVHRAAGEDLYPIGFH